MEGKKIFFYVALFIIISTKLVELGNQYSTVMSIYHLITNIVFWVQEKVRLKDTTFIYNVPDSDSGVAGRGGGEHRELQQNLIYDFYLIITCELRKDKSRYH